jgi:hypothetical protein
MVSNHARIIFILAITLALAATLILGQRRGCHSAIVVIYPNDTIRPLVFLGSKSDNIDGKCLRYVSSGIYMANFATSSPLLP